MSRKSLRYLMMGTTLALVAAAAFFAARYALSDNGNAVAQAPPAPAPQALEMIRRSEADKAKPKFIGDKNGFIFREPRDVPPPADCAGLTGGDKATDTQIAASPFNFSAAYLPPGMKEIFHTGNVCRGVVVAVTRSYSASPGAPITVMHIKNGPAVTANAPEERLQAITIAGRPAVLQTPIFEGDYVEILMKDSLGGYFTISGTQITPAELQKVAEAVK